MNFLSLGWSFAWHILSFSLLRVILLSFFSGETFSCHFLLWIPRGDQTLVAPCGLWEPSVTCVSYFHIENTQLSHGIEPTFSLRSWHQTFHLLLSHYFLILPGGVIQTHTLAVLMSLNCEQSCILWIINKVWAVAYGHLFRCRCEIEGCSHYMIAS